MKKNIKKPSFFPRNIKLPWATSKPKRNYEVDLAEWLNFAAQENWITSGSVPNPMIADVTIDQAGYDITYDGRTTPQGVLTHLGLLASGKQAAFYSGSEDFVPGVGVIGSAMYTFDPTSFQTNIVGVGDLRNTGVVAHEEGFLAGALDFNADNASGIFLASVNPSTGASEVRMQTNVFAGTTGNAESSLKATTAGSGDALIDVAAQVGTAGTDAVVDVASVGTDATNTLTSRLRTVNSANSTDTRWQVVDNTVQLVGNNGATVRFTIPDDFGAATYADDTAASGGGVAIGEWYLRTTGEVAQRLT